MAEGGGVKITEHSRRPLRPLVTGHLPTLRITVVGEGLPITDVLIHGSAIKTHGKPWRFNNLQFSNRQ
jgi:hypothetical protein